MIRIECDRCERGFEVEEGAAGTKVPCPSCGDVNRVPAGHGNGTGRASAQRDRAADAGLPPDSGPEQPVLRIRRAWFRSRPMAFTGVVAVATGGVAGLVWSGRVGHPATALWAWGALVVAALGVLAFWWLERFMTCLVVTNKRTVRHQGLLSRSTSEVVHDNIRNVQVDQTFWQRVWGVGRLGISSSGQDGIEIQINHLPGPDKVRQTIDLYRPL